MFRLLAVPLCTVLVWLSILTTEPFMELSAANELANKPPLPTAIINELGSIAEATLCKVTGTCGPPPKNEPLAFPPGQSVTAPPGALISQPAGTPSGAIIVKAPEPSLPPGSLLAPAPGVAENGSDYFPLVKALFVNDGLGGNLGSEILTDNTTVTIFGSKNDTGEATSVTGGTVKRQPNVNMPMTSVDEIDFNTLEGYYAEVTTQDGRLEMSFPTFTSADQTNISTFYRFTSFAYTQSQPSFNFTIVQPAQEVFTAAVTSTYYERGASGNGRKLLSVQSACDTARKYLVDKCNDLNDLGKSALASITSNPVIIDQGTKIGALAITAAKARIIAALKDIAAAENALAAEIAGQALPAGIDLAAEELLLESAASATTAALVAEGAAATTAAVAAGTAALLSATTVATAVVGGFCAGILVGDAIFNGRHLLQTEMYTCQEQTQACDDYGADDYC